MIEAIFFLAAIWLLIGFGLLIAVIRDGAKNYNLIHFAIVVIAGPPVLIALLILGWRTSNQP